MTLKGFYTAMTALSLVVVPTVAVAAPIATPLTQPVPASESVSGDNALVGGVGFFILLLAVGAVAAGVAAGATNTNTDLPTSP